MEAMEVPLRAQLELIDPGNRDLPIAGTLLPGAQYLKALDARRVIADAMRHAFGDNSLTVVVTPTLPATAADKSQTDFTFGDLVEPVTLSVPCGFDAAELPVGLQIAGRPFDEATVIQVGLAYEAATKWHLDFPPIHATAEAP